MTEVDTTLLERWDAVRSTGIEPTFATELSDDPELRTEFLRGAQIMGLDSERKPLHPQQLYVADCLNGGRTFYGVLLPRRSSKTTTIFAFALGRCLSRDDYLVGFTCATTGIKTRTRFMDDIVKPLQRLYPDPSTRPFKIALSKGEERIEFPNGSRFVCLPPDGEKFRGDAFSMIIVDESGEANPETTDDLTEGFLPTTDTVPDALVVITGTAAEYRTGNLLWGALSDGMSEDEADSGAIAYMAPQDLIEQDLIGPDGDPSWELAEPYFLTSHPGVGTLTTIEKMQVNFRKLKLAQVLREYLSVFPNLGASAGAIPAEAWAKMENTDPDLPTPPARFALAFGVTPNSSHAAIVAAWREGDRARILVLDHRPGVNWLVPTVAAISKRAGVSIVYDSKLSAVKVQAERLARKRPKPKMAEQTIPQVLAAHELFAKEVADGVIEHFNQPPLSEAARLAGWRKGRGDNRMYGRTEDGDDICALEAGILALRAYDDLPPARPDYASLTAA
ncbi:hypothetical protein C5C41_06725 [Rathayibacter sp. AY1E9]|uniref:hypothetical protein n=1 Tax=Rathayibacter sp. AY1E9 TaxID=2080556 RepID=UPI000CE83D86|nr:hypothetical protein [Rathayibacter sp. AY1E9]PPG53413.1 hypothetical protein C5C41_06725 [Rathayibacter sp. AY1E9]